MALLNSLTDRSDGLINALDLLGNDERLFTFDVLTSRFYQEKQRQDKREKDSNVNTESAYLLAARSDSRLNCTHCDDRRCLNKYTHINSRNNKSLVGKEGELSSTEFFIAN